MSANEFEGGAYLALATASQDNGQFGVWIARTLGGEGSYSDLAALWPLAVRK